MARIRAAVVLAAGGSSRMGAPKALLALGDRPVIAWHCRALGASADRTIVVLGADGDRIRAALPSGVLVVENPEWRTTTPIDSLALALRSAEGIGEALVTPVDTAPAEPETLSALLAAGGPAVPLDTEGRPGHPVLLDPGAIDTIRSSPPEGGLRTLLVDVRRVPVADPLVSLDFDDPEAWRRVSREWAERRR